jgi:hypothetical protein
MKTIKAIKPLPGQKELFDDESDNFKLKPGRGQKFCQLCGRIIGVRSSICPYCHKVLISNGYNYNLKKVKHSKTLVEKSNFVESNPGQIRDSFALMKSTADLQISLNVSGSQTTWQIARDICFVSKIGGLVNTNKHGYDVMIGGRPDELKHGNSATFNDTTLKKIAEYENSLGRLWLVHWTGDGDCNYADWLPLSNKYLVNFLREKVENKNANSRSTQTVRRDQLILWGACTINLPAREEIV